MSVRVPYTGLVMCVRTNGEAGEWIRFGASLIHEDDLVNHVAVLHHQDETGRWWGIEGRPGGVGWVDATSYIESQYTISNEREVISSDVRLKVANTMAGLLGVPYDWRAIGEDAVRDLHLPDLWAEKWKGLVAPGHVVCSSAAAVAYRDSKLPYPSNVDIAHVQPADWADFLIQNHYD
jgi:hypothetical protein